MIGRVGHAEDEVRRRAAERMAESGAEVRDVVQGPPAERRALVRSRRDPHVEDTVVLDLARIVLVAVQDSRYDLDVVVLGEGFATP